MLDHCRGKRSIHPWELDDEDSKAASATPTDGEAALEGSESLPTHSEAMRVSKMEPFGQSSRCENEAWVQRWRQRPTLRKLFHQMPADAADRGMQLIRDQIVVQSIAWGTLTTTILTVVFTLLPVGKFYQ